MIKQAYVQASDQPEPALKEIKDRIETAVDATEGGTGLKRLACWLQMPVDSAFEKMMDSNCQARAKEVGALLSGKDGLFTPADLGSVLSAPPAWAGIDKALKTGSAVYVNGPADHVGGRTGPARQGGTDRGHRHGRRPGRHRGRHPGPR
ncbi:hypothetical protein, partial [Streptomyces lavendulae]|uniref:hypothetical protein n=1 Tax=Streptomyces lavendulae TaxID=1914 RepID=UPI0033EF14F0